MSSQQPKFALIPRSLRGGVSVRSLAVAAGLAAIAGPVFAQPATAAPPRAASGAQVGEVIVTAQFRSQNLQTTPLAITALTGDMLEARNNSSITDVSNAAPNVTIRMAPQGFGNSAQVFIRGVGQTDFKYALEPGVGMYVDDVYYPTLFGTVFDLLDLDRVEILRGPQGTLAGKNSIGGAVKLYAKKPTGDGHGYAQATYGSYDRVEVRAGIDIPIVADKLFLRVSGVGKRRSGYVDRLDFTCVNPSLAGTLPSHALAPGDCKIGTEGGTKELALRAAARWLVTPNLEVNLEGDILRDDSEAQANTLMYVDPRGYAGPADTSNVLGQTAAWNYQYNMPHYGILFDNRFLPANPFQDYTNFTDNKTGVVSPAVSTTHSWGVQGTIDWNLTPDLALKSITAYRKYDGEFSQDLDTSPLSLQTLYHHLYHHQFSQELRLSGKALADRVDWVFGGFHIDGVSTDKGLVNIAQSSSAPPAPPAVRPYTNSAGLVFMLNDPVTDRNNSAFGHLTVHATDKLEVEGGVRYSDEKKVYTFFRSNPVLAAINGPAPPSQFTRWDYRADVNYRWTPQFMTYASVSTGFRGGGVNPRPFTPSQALPFGPEKLTAYEIGFKSDLLDRRVRLNAAGFFNVYRDLQLSAAGVINGFSVVIPRNVGLAHVKGLEGEVEIHPSERFLINASASYLDFQYIDLGSAAGVPGGPCLSCKPPLSPTTKLNAGIQYEFPFAGGMTLTPRVDATYQSQIFNEATNNPRSAQPGYTTVDARLTLRSPDRGWEAAVFVTNLTNTFYYYNIFDSQNSFGLISGQPGRPREWAVSVKRNF